MSLHSSAPSQAPSYDRHAFQPNTLVAERYVIERRIAVGGMGTVYAARQRPFMRRVALKVMHPNLTQSPTLRDRFYSEALAISRLSHPNTITIFDFGYTEPGDCFIAMEYVEGEPLSVTLDREGHLEMSRAVTIALQIAQSLGEAHAKGIIHRDLKPENVMLQHNPGGSQEFVKVVDFGIARILGQATRSTQEGLVCGTPMYMAPEQGRGHEVDQRADLYALACCLYEMLTGYPPYDAENAVELLMHHQQASIPHLPTHYPHTLDRFLQRAMAKSPSDRPSDAGTFAAELTACFMRLRRPSGEVAYANTPLSASGRYDTVRRDSPRRELAYANTPLSTSGRQLTVRRASNPSQPARPVRMTSPGRPAIADERDAPPANPNTNLPPVLVAPPIPNSKPPYSSTTPVPKFQQALPSPHVPMLSSTPAHNALPSHMTPSKVVSPMASAPTLPATSISAVPKSQATPTVVTSPPTPPAEAKRWVQQPTGLVLAIAVCVGFAFAVGAIALVQNLSPTSKEVVLDTSPQGALVVVNGQELGVTPLTWPTDETQLSVVFKLDGYKPFEAKAIDLASQERRIFRSLEPLQMQLALTLPIQGARVKVGAIDMGSLPANRPRSITVDWPTTPLPVVIEHPDYAPLRYTITAPMARETMTLSFKTEDFVPR